MMFSLMPPRLLISASILYSQQHTGPTLPPTSSVQEVEECWKELEEEKKAEAARRDTGARQKPDQRYGMCELTDIVREGMGDG